MSMISLPSGGSRFFTRIDRTQLPQYNYKHDELPSLHPTKNKGSTHILPPISIPSSLATKLSAAKSTQNTCFDHTLWIPDRCDKLVCLLHRAVFPTRTHRPPSVRTTGRACDYSTLQQDQDISRGRNEGTAPIERHRPKNAFPHCGRKDEFEFGV